MKNSEDKYTIKTNFGLPDRPETEITLYRSLKGNEKIKEVIKQVKQIDSDVQKLMVENPELYDSLLSIRRQTIKLELDLGIQYDGFIMY